MRDYTTRAVDLEKRGILRIYKRLFQHLLSLNHIT